MLQSYYSRRVNITRTKRKVDFISSGIEETERGRRPTKPSKIQRAVRNEALIQDTYMQERASVNLARRKIKFA